ncbi:MAG: DUF3326 domain-containing protein [Candidatus Gastranaerophilales bacterium]|nr:DUF3326 domain-containing protein [Candidatus Gastranaerophilales bacterium]
MCKEFCKNRKLGAFIVPTGVGASIGGYAGDASTWARRFAEVSTLIVNPNVVNAGGFSGITENMLYVEGYSLDEFFKGNIGLVPSAKNKVGVVFDKGISEAVLNIHINTINAVKTVYDLDIIYEVTQKVLETDFFVDLSGISTGKINNIETILKSAKNLLSQGAEAVAIVCKFKDDNQNTAYESGIGVDPIGGLEAIISHYISKELRVPAAHAPAFEDFSISTKIVDPKSASEYITPTFLPCILIGLSQAPRIVAKQREKKEKNKWKMENGKWKIFCSLLTAHCSLLKPFILSHQNDSLLLTVSDLDFLVMPYNSLGSVPVFEAIKRGIKVFAVKENQTVLNVTKNSLLLDKIIEINTYQECLNKIIKTPVEKITTEGELAERKNKISLC